MKNLIAATYAPMHQDGSLNQEIIGKYATFLEANRITAAFVNGSTGDFVSLSVVERKQLIEAWAVVKPDDFMLINHVGHNNIREAKELAMHSADKVDAIAALAPYYFKITSLDKLVAYCREIASCAPGLPFYYYHIPILTGAQFPMIDFLKKAVKEIPSFAGIKYTHTDLTDFQKCKTLDNGTANILFGVDEQLLSSLSHNADGWVGSTYNHLAPLYYQIISCFKNNKMEEASLLQEKAVFFVETLDKLGGFNGAGKSFMKLFGLPMGPSRFPHNTLSHSQLSSAITSFEKRGLLPYLGSQFSLQNLTSQV